MIDFLTLPGICGRQKTTTIARTCIIWVLNNKFYSIWQDTIQLSSLDQWNPEISQPETMQQRPL